MTKDVAAALGLIHRVERDPRLLYKKQIGAMLSVDVAEAALLVADDAAHRGDTDTLSWLWDLLINTFHDHERARETGADFIDPYEYVTDLEFCVKDHEDPFENTVLMEYRKASLTISNKCGKNLVVQRRRESTSLIVTTLAAYISFLGKGSSHDTAR